MRQRPSAVMAGLMLGFLPDRAMSGERGNHDPLPVCIELSNEGKRVHLHGEEVGLAVTIRNDGRGALGYLRLACENPFISGLSLLVLRDGHRIPAPEFRDPWGEGAVDVAQLAVNASLRQTISLSSHWQGGALPVGEYAITAHLKQADRPGVTSGSAVSNTMQFSVKDWRAAEKSEKVVELRGGSGRVLGVTEVQLVRTTDGQRLVTWKTTLSRSATSYFRAVPLPPKLSISVPDAVWRASPEKCHILLITGQKAGRKLITVEAAKSSVTEVDLPAGAGLPDDGEQRVKP